MRLLATILLLLFSSSPALAQVMDPVGGTAVESAAVAAFEVVRAPAFPDAARTPAGAFAASLLVPGAGQAALGARRWVAYGALEVGLWALRLGALGDRRHATAAYRDLAWEVARLPGDAPRQEGSWGYYETLTAYARSGAFDTDPAETGIQPEHDPDTYNGYVWQLARSLYLPDGEGGPGTVGYARAVEYYAERAAGPEFLWSWEGNDGAWSRYRVFIDDADSASRVARIALGAVLANHIVAAVDALILARLQSESGFRLESRIPSAAPLRWSLALHIPLQDLQ